MRLNQAAHMVGGVEQRIYTHVAVAQLWGAPKTTEHPMSETRSSVIVDHTEELATSSIILSLTTTSTTRRLDSPRRRVARRNSGSAPYEY
jgi:hypothetical protein